MAALALPEGSLIGGAYRVHEKLAAGGMGALYVAYHARSGARCALKILAPALAEDPKSRERFAREAQIAREIDSPHVVKVYEAGFDEAAGVPWIAMELLEGRDLSAAIDAFGHLPPSDAWEICAQIGDALGKAHEKKIIHLDLKPANVFLARPIGPGGAPGRGKPSVKILDFGISRVASASKTAATMTTSMGTPSWMAPEQADTGANVRPSADVWSFGLLVFYILTGRSYWPAMSAPSYNPMALSREVFLDPLPSASQRALSLGVPFSLPAGFDAWIGRCLVRDPRRRFQDMTQATAALRPVLASARPATPIAVQNPTIETESGAHFALPNLSLGEDPTVPAPLRPGSPSSGAQGPGPTEVLRPRKPSAASQARGAATLLVGLALALLVVAGLFWVKSGGLRELVQGERGLEVVSGAEGEPGAPVEAPAPAEALSPEEEERIFQEGLRALAADDLVAAEAAFERLPEGSASLERPEVQAARRRLAERRLAEARGLLRTDPEAARALALRVSRTPGLPDRLRREAEQLSALRAAQGP